MAPPAEKLRETPLHDVHEALGARLVDFAGWSMPVQYSGILDEHQAVRSAAGLFDISHMGQVFVTGTAAEAWLNTMLTNDVRRLSPGECQYSLLLNEAGGVIDDLIVYRLEDQQFLLVVNASRAAADLKWMRTWATDNADITFDEERFGLALQGPQALAILEKVFPEEFHAPARNELEVWSFRKHPILVCRTGYTGEDGFEFFGPAEIAKTFWEEILEQGRGRGCKPAGLGARDTLRLEACLPLYGHELDATISPIEAGLSAFVCFDKAEKFNGRDALRQQKEKGTARRLVAFETTGPGAPPRAGYAVLHDGRPVGQVTSGILSPTLKKGIGLALIESASAAVGTPLTIRIRDNDVPAVVGKRPLYKRPS